MTSFILTNRPNRYAANCHACGVRVPEGEGWINKVDGRWLTVHAEACPTQEVPVIEAPTGRHSWSYSAEAETYGAQAAEHYEPKHRWFYSQEAEQTGPAHVSPAPEVPGFAGPGYYVRGAETFRVVENKAKTATYAKRLRVYGERLTWEYAPGVGRDLLAEGLTPMTSEEAGRLGLLHGRCINCFRSLGGESLSAQVSALIGYGETCADNNHWHYPKGAAAQREYIATH